MIREGDFKSSPFANSGEPDSALDNLRRGPEETTNLSEHESRQTKVRRLTRQTQQRNQSSGWTPESVKINGRAAEI